MDGGNFQCLSEIFLDFQIRFSKLHFAYRHPPSYPPYQSWRLFDELHVYDLKENRWTLFTPLEGPPPMVSIRLR